MKAMAIVSTRPGQGRGSRAKPQSLKSWLLLPSSAGVFEFRSICESSKSSKKTMKNMNFMGRYWKLSEPADTEISSQSM